MDLREIHSEDVFGPSLGRVWMSRSKVKVTRDKAGKTAASSPLTVHCNVCTVHCKWCAAADGTIPSPSGGDGSAWWQELSAACVRCMFGKTSLALISYCHLQWLAMCSCLHRTYTNSAKVTSDSLFVSFTFVEHWVVYYVPLPSNRWHLSIDDCLEDKREVIRTVVLCDSFSQWYAHMSSS